MVQRICSVVEDPTLVRNITKIVFLHVFIVVILIIYNMTTYTDTKRFHANHFLSTQAFAAILDVYTPFRANKNLSLINMPPSRCQQSLLAHSEHESVRECM